MRTHQIMTRSVTTVAPDATILEAANIMLRQHVSGLPVVDAAGKLVGIVSEGDFIRRSEIGTQRKRGRWLKFLLGAGLTATDYVHEHGRKVSEVMTADLVTVRDVSGIARRRRDGKGRLSGSRHFLRADRFIRACSRSMRA